MKNGKYMKKTSKSWAKPMGIIVAVVVPALICVILFLAFRSDVLKNAEGNTIVQAKEIIEKVVPNIADQSADGVPTEKTADAALFAQQLDSGEGETDNQSVLNNQTPEFFNELPETFTSITSSASTTWNISINPDGSFISTVKIPNWGDNTPDYPLGTSKITETHGQFANFEKGSDYSYKMTAAQAENIGPFGKTYISDDVRYIVTDTAYIKAGDAYDLYLPGTPYSELPQGLIDSVNNNGRHSMDEITPNTFILYHAIPGSNGYDAVYIGNRNSSPNISQQAEAPMSAQLDVASTFGFTKSWDIHDRSGTDHYVTSLAFHSDGTFSCCAGWYQSELFAAVTGTYAINGDTLSLRYTFNGKQTDVEYQVDWENRLFRQLSEENLLIPHQIGSEYPFEESSEYSAEDRDRHVRLFLQGGGLPLGD